MQDSQSVYTMTVSYTHLPWLDSMFNAGLLPIDAIGLSFYSFWHGTFMDLKDTMSRIIQLYNLPVYIVETAHPWSCLLYTSQALPD